jgi:poly-beta-1,6-N-acetyl-D-glucosamine N-deacetylase
VLLTVLCGGLLAGPPEIVRDLRTRTPVLTYHDIVPERGRGTVWFDCTTNEFRMQLEWLTAHGAHFISVDQLYAHLTKGSPLPNHAIALTFADNYLGFYERALPILRARHIPVAMFVHTGYVGSPIGRPKMTWGQLQELDREGLVTIASQTRTHPPSMTALSDRALREELVGSKKALESHLGHPIPYFAYPNGSYDSRAARAAKAAGYTMAFTEVLTPAERSPSIFMVARYVHTKFKRAWADAHGR